MKAVYLLAAAVHCGYWTLFYALWVLAILSEIGARRAGRPGALQELMRRERETS